MEDKDIISVGSPVCEPETKALRKIILSGKFKELIKDIKTKLPNNRNPKIYAETASAFNGVRFTIEEEGEAYEVIIIQTR